MKLKPSKSSKNDRRRLRAAVLSDPRQMTLNVWQTRWRTAVAPSSRTSREGSPQSMARAYGGSEIGRCGDRGENIVNAPSALAELALLDRYERRAPSRRKAPPDPFQTSSGCE
jgi:hypothetical protein